MLGNEILLSRLPKVRATNMCSACADDVMMIVLSSSSCVVVDVDIISSSSLPSSSSSDVLSTLHYISPSSIPLSLSLSLPVGNGISLFTTHPLHRIFATLRGLRNIARILS